MTEQLPRRPTWVEVDLDKLAGNIRACKSILPEETAVMAVVKADAYGHGVKMTAETALKAGASYLGVAFLEEGIELRQAGIKAPVLVLGYLSPQEVPIAADYNLTVTVFSDDVAQAAIATGKAKGAPLPVHVKVDTGMGRIGLHPEAAFSFIRRLAHSNYLHLEGVFTHFAAADDSDPAYTRQQIKSFNQLLKRCAEAGINIPLRHAANSAGAMLFPDSCLDMVRLGISMYGYYPDPQMKWPVKLQPAASWHTRLVHVKRVPVGSAISYGCTFVTRRETVVGTLPVGYADGYWRLLSNKGSVLVKGKQAPVIGRVCMDQTMIDVTDIPEAVTGDPVILMGCQDSLEITADDIADLVGTISYEILTSLGRRVPRVYKQGGREVAVQSLSQRL